MLKSTFFCFFSYCRSCIELCVSFGSNLKCNQKICF